MTASLLLILALAPAAQTPIDATKPGGAILPAPAVAPGSGYSRGVDACDDFDRASGTNMGLDWSEVQGDFGIIANTGYALGSGSQYMIENNAIAGVFGSDMQVDFLPKVSGSNLVYVALVSGYADTLNNVFIKVQDNNSDGLYDRVFFYGGINGSPWNTTSYFFDLATPTDSGRMDVYFTGGGDVANLDITNNTSGLVEHFESSGVLSSGLIFGLQFGIGAFNSPAFDNYELNDGCTGGPSLAVSNLVAGSTATATVTNATPGGQVGIAYSAAGPGPSNAPAGPCGIITVDLSQPISVLPLVLADASGMASASGPVPAGTSGVTVYFHALDLASCTLSNSFGLTIL